MPGMPGLVLMAQERADAGTRFRHGHEPLHQVIGEVRQRVADGREFPVQHRDDARLGGVDDAIVEPEVAMDDGGARIRRAGAGQPGDELVHLGDRLGLRGAVLLAPALDLPRHIALRLAEIGKARVLPDRAYEAARWWR